MSEYWVSRKTWTCKYCNLTINDDAPSRLQHENGMRHKGNVERALKEVYRKSENERREKREAEAEMKKINRAAEASYAADLAGNQITTSAEPTTSTASDEPSETAPAPPGPPPIKPSEPKSKGKEKDEFSDYTTAESLGFSEDPEVLRKQEEEKRRVKEGFAGDWEEVSSSSNQRPSILSSTAKSIGEVNNVMPPSERQKAREFKIKEKSGSVFNDEDDDDGLGDIKVRKRIKIENRDELIQREEENRKRMLPQWQNLRLEIKKEKRDSTDNQRDGTEDRTESSTIAQDSGSGTHSLERLKDNDQAKVKKEEDEDGKSENPSDSTPSNDIKVKREESSPTRTVEGKTANESRGAAPEGGEGMFKKRKARGGGGAKKVRALV